MREKVPLTTELNSHLETFRRLQGEGRTPMFELQQVLTNNELPSRDLAESVIDYLSFSPFYETDPTIEAAIDSLSTFLEDQDKQARLEARPEGSFCQSNYPAIFRFRDDEGKIKIARSPHSETFVASAYNLSGTIYESFAEHKSIGDALKDLENGIQVFYTKLEF